MAKRTARIDDSLFRRTEEDAPERGAARGSAAAVPATGRTLSVGVGLKESEVDMLDAIAGDLGIARNALLRYLVRYGLAQYRAGYLDVPVRREERYRIEMP
ncbi:MAG TPA: hypothetical protein GX714_16955 [Chloroflexi bacterium]|jgi:hypothetical protein|nr:hypothetical protein [Chloroflexota bacterium]